MSRRTILDSCCYAIKNMNLLVFYFIWNFTFPITEAAPIISNWDKKYTFFKLGASRLSKNTVKIVLFVKGSL